MAQLLGEVKINQFLEHIVTQFNIGEFEKEEFMYKFNCNDALCAIGYERQNKLFSRNYNFTIIIEKTIEASSAAKQEVNYSFRKKCWVGKTPSSLLVLANKHFSLDWNMVDFTSLTLSEDNFKRILKMTVLPGSYTSLIFPPMRQAIALYEEEIKALQSIITIVSSKLDCSM